ncbi:hypothetical protein BKH41_09130 [Helicobacter sp. 12S02232-10]|uniref:hypothetical protein n=1 Tax=Helicobacter sp. 12S02232-10 TaxID=1476197 RepID=UPI000BA4FCA4|nr:hypothetical protein [Helicobacter sp. 12S02232-10]PAF46465.1 hypothetical protein BKH41_09130 [Helicobacter sp. 12S02232-10]
MSITEIISKILSKLSVAVSENIFYGAQRVYTNKILLSFLFLLMVFWLIANFDNDNKKGMIKTAFIYLSIFVFVEAILQSKNAYFFCIANIRFSSFAFYRSNQTRYGRQYGY